MHRAPRIVFMLLFAGALFYGGFYVGQQSVPQVTQVTGLSNLETNKPEDVDFDTFWKVWNTINEKYVATEAVSTEDKVWGAIKGLTDSLGDPYSVFLPPDENKAFEEMITGSFGGVGMEIGEQDGVIVVIAPLKGTPADRAGIRAGDSVLMINDTATAGITVDEAVNLIRGEPGTVVQLGIRRGEGEMQTIPVTRDIISIPTLETETRGDVFIISLYNFDALSLSDFRRAMTEWGSSPADKLILDLRGNPGGYLESAVSIASYFVPTGDVIVRERVDGEADEVVHRSKGLVLNKQPKKIVVLVNEGSASASEILAGALQEHHLATLVGTKTFGKGSVQELIPITLTTSLKLTVAQWLTPNGNSISKGGLTPDVVAEITLDDIAAGKDPQMDRALEIVHTQ